jgi:agmatine deiminase
MSTWRMPAETEPHTCTWMAWPSSGYADGEDARQAWASVTLAVAEWAGATIVSSAMVNEGGGMHVDGHGTVLVTETVQLDPSRNPGWTRERVEGELRRTLGVREVVWLPRGLTRDYAEFGTRGHVDIVATFASPKTALLHVQLSSKHPDHTVPAEIRAALNSDWTVIDLPAPEGPEDVRGPVDHSYVNHLVCNAGVVACTFGDPRDAEALDILAAAYPGRRVIGFDARSIFARGGGIHCITQQEPAIPGGES